MLHYETPWAARALGQRCTTCVRAHAMVILFNAEESEWVLGLPARAAGWQRGVQWGALLAASHEQMTMAVMRQGAHPRQKRNK
jgi:hypothetical protein